MSLHMWMDLIQSADLMWSHDLTSEQPCEDQLMPAGLLPAAA